MATSTTSPSSPSSPSQSTFEIKARAITDYWRKPPSINTSNAPSAYSVTLPSHTFTSARVTVSADWTRLYDQGGLLVHLPSTVVVPVGEGQGQGESKRRCWVKTGIEFVGGEPKVSVVAAREWADWSLNTLPRPTSKSVTIELVREQIDIANGKGSSLFVYLVEDEETGRRGEVPIREVTWAFEQEGEIEVGLYAARPTKLDGDGGESELNVKFEAFSINVSLGFLLSTLLYYHVATRMRPWFCQA